MTAVRLALSFAVLMALGANTDVPAEVVKKAPRVISCDAACLARRAAKKEQQERAEQLAAAKKARLEKRKAAKAAATAAENRRQMEAEIAASKAIEAKRAKEPGMVRQTCQMVGGKLECK
jgi:hypothetical protein